MLPDLKFDDGVLHGESFNVEIYPDGGEGVAVEIVVHIPLHQGRLTAGLETQTGQSVPAGMFPSHRISNDDNLEDIIESGGGGSLRFILGLPMILPETQSRQFSLVVLQPVFL